MWLKGCRASMSPRGALTTNCSSLVLHIMTFCFFFFVILSYKVFVVCIWLILALAICDQPNLYPLSLLRDQSLTTTTFQSHCFLAGQHSTLKQFRSLPRVAFLDILTIPGNSPDFKSFPSGIPSFRKSQSLCVSHQDQRPNIRMGDLPNSSEHQLKI